MRSLQNLVSKILIFAQSLWFRPHSNTRPNTRPNPLPYSFPSTDIDGSGSIDAMELMRALHMNDALGPITLEQMAQIFKVIDVNQDGKISKEEFRAFVGTSTVLTQRAVTNKMVRAVTTSGLPSDIMLRAIPKLRTHTQLHNLWSGFGTSLIGPGMRPIGTERLTSAEVIGVYFSAHWCGPCRQFTPQLVKTYNAMKARGCPIEILFISADHNQSEMESYFATMPWIAGQFGQSTAELKAIAGQGIPELIFFKTDGTLITKDGRALVDRDGSGGAIMKAAKEATDIVSEGGTACVLLVFCSLASGFLAVHIYGIMVGTKYSGGQTSVCTKAAEWVTLMSCLCLFQCVVGSFGASAMEARGWTDAPYSTVRVMRACNILFFLVIVAFLLLGIYVFYDSKLITEGCALEMVNFGYYYVTVILSLLGLGCGGCCLLTLHTLFCTHF